MAVLVESNSREINHFVPDVVVVNLEPALLVHSALILWLHYLNRNLEYVNKISGYYLSNAGVIHRCDSLFIKIFLNLFFIYALHRYRSPKFLKRFINFDFCTAIIVEYHHLNQFLIQLFQFEQSHSDTLCVDIYIPFCLGACVK